MNVNVSFIGVVEWRGLEGLLVWPGLGRCGGEPLGALDHAVSIGGLI